MAVFEHTLVRTLFHTYFWILLASEATAMPQAPPESTSEPPSSSLTYYIYPTPDAIDNPTVDDPNALLEGQPLTMVMHGFKGDHTARSMHAIKEALLMSGVDNVVVLDWSDLADAPDSSALTAYHHVRDHGVVEAAAQASRWIQAAMDTRGISPGDVHLIGFSLGAHVAGIIGQNMESALGRITGLDPPRFGYEKVDESQRLDRGDAQFVNCMHTSGGILSYTEKKPIGHVDFFPNGDTVPQKGCPYDDPIDIITCSHYMAFSLFAESVFHKNALIGTACDSWSAFSQGHCKNGTQAPMGYSTPNTVRGKFYMNTNTQPPFGEDDPDNPLPDNILSLLTYNTNESFINPQDLGNFVRGSEPLEEQPQGDDPQGDDSGIMKVKGGSKTTTTPDPPSFLSSAADSLVNSGVMFMMSSMVGYNVLEFLWEWWNGR